MLESGTRAGQGSNAGALSASHQPTCMLECCTSQPAAQVTNDDTRIVSLADPATGEVVARMVMGPGAELRPNGTAAAAGGFQHFPAAVPAEAGATATSIAALVGCLLYFLALMALLVTIPLSMTADAGERAALAACEGPAGCMQGQGPGRICICMRPGWSAPPSVLLCAQPWGQHLPTIRNAFQLSPPSPGRTHVSQGATCTWFAWCSYSW